MLIPFECTKANINSLRLRVMSYEKSLREQGVKIFSHAPYDKEGESESFYKGIISKCRKDDVIEGSDLQTLNFPFDESAYNVFISYSHDDEKEAFFLYQWLTSHGLSCFLDSTIWHSADSLLKEIDAMYCPLKDGRKGFDYNKRNFSTSHVHAMLSMAILKAIDMSECCIFIKSSNSVPLQEGIENKTLSPWIYEENLFMDRIRRRVPERYLKKERKLFSQGGRIIVEDAAKKLKIAYNLECEFTHITSLDIFSLKGGVSALDALYEKFGALEQIGLI